MAARWFGGDVERGLCRGNDIRITGFLKEYFHTFCKLPKLRIIRAGLKSLQLMNNNKYINRGLPLTCVQNVLIPLPSAHRKYVQGERQYNNKHFGSIRFDRSKPEQWRSYYWKKVWVYSEHHKDIGTKWRRLLLRGISELKIISSFLVETNTKASTIEASYQL